MNGLFVDNNIGEMFTDIFNDATQGIKDAFSDNVSDVFDNTKFGLGELTIHVPTGDELWKNFLPIMVIVGVIIIALIIRAIANKHRKKNQSDSAFCEVDQLMAEAEAEAYAKENAKLYAEFGNQGPSLEDKIAALDGDVEPESQDEPDYEQAFMNAKPQQAEAPDFEQAFLQAKAERDSDYEPDFKPQFKQPEPEPIKMEKIEVVTTKPSVKYGAKNSNTTRSGRVFTEEELKQLIRK